MRQARETRDVRGRHRKPRPLRSFYAVGGLALAAGALSLARVAPESGTADIAVGPSADTVVDTPGEVVVTARATPAAATAAPTETTTETGTDAGDQPRDRAGEQGDTGAVPRGLPAVSSAPGAAGIPRAVSSLAAAQLPVPTATPDPTGIPGATSVPPAGSTAPEPTRSFTPAPGTSSPAADGPQQPRNPGMCLPVVRLCFGGPQG
ncbi:hypothetical protein [Streptomyces cavernae]|uniref:hypothetical protein n=1 Tax=Streptomyces cavernae TaxID=2259034 RepID=UPI000FEBDFFC|nr:hypothetical protein [Streptomyces cavernae]